MIQVLVPTKHPRILPLELEFTIIDVVAAIAEDKSTLIACSLVCRTWTEHCRQFLFHSIACSPTSAPRLVRFLSLPWNPGQHIRTLRWVHFQELLRQRDVGSYLDQIFHYLHSHTTTQVFDSTRWLLPSPGIETMVTIFQFASVRKLVHHETMFISWAFLLHMVSRYSTLEELVLDYITITKIHSPSAEFMSGVPPPPSLKTLSILGPTAANDDALLHWLQHPNTPAHIAKLTLATNNVAFANIDFRKLATHLTEVEILVVHPVLSRTPVTKLFELDFTPCIHLTTLRVTCKSVFPHLPATLPFLASLHLPQLESLQLTGYMTRQEMSESDRIHWSRNVDSPLCKSGFVALKHLLVEVTVGSNQVNNIRNALKPFLEMVLPTLHQRIKVDSCATVVKIPPSMVRRAVVGRSR